MNIFKKEEFSRKQEKKNTSNLNNTEIIEIIIIMFMCGNVHKMCKKNFFLYILQLIQYYLRNLCDQVHTLEEPKLI